MVEKAAGGAVRSVYGADETCKVGQIGVYIVGNNLYQCVLLVKGKYLPIRSKSYTRGKDYQFYYKTRFSPLFFSLYHLVTKGTT